MRRAAFVLALALASSPASPRAEEAAVAAAGSGRHCFESPEPALLVEAALLGLVNPLGVEQQLRAWGCRPLIRRPGLLFDYTNLEAGLVGYLAPVYSHLGAFVGITPLSVLQLRAEATWVEVWPLGAFHSGHFPMPAYRADFSTSARDPLDPGRASGLDVLLTATLRGQLRLGPSLELLLASSFSADYFELGDDRYYYNLRRDVVLARAYWVLKNTALAMLQLRLRDGAWLRAGLTDDFTWVPGSGYRGHMAGLLATVRLLWSGRELQPFVRGGYWFAPFHEGWHFTAGIGFVHDLYRWR